MPVPLPSRALLLLATAPLFAACEIEEPVTPAATYHASMQPLMSDNAKVARDLQSLAAEIKKDAPEAEQVAARLQEDVLPEVRSLAKEAAEVAPQDPAIADAHALVVEAWGDRVKVVEQTLEAWRKADGEAARAAADQRYGAARAEARYFEAINEILVPEGYVLQPYGAR